MAHPMPSMNERVLDVPTGSLQRALIQALDNSKTVLTVIHHNNDIYQLASTALKPVLEGSHIITHQKKHNSPIFTNYTISMDDEHAYALLATLDGPIRKQLLTFIGFGGSAHSQIVHIQLNPRTRSVLGRTHHDLFVALGTQDLATHITMPKYNIEKGITGRKAYIIMWATVLLHNVDTLEVSEEAIRHLEQDLE